MYQISRKRLKNKFSLQINFEFLLKSFRFPSCHIFMGKKTRDKAGFGDKSGCDKSEDALYIN